MYLIAFPPATERSNHTTETYRIAGEVALDVLRAIDHHAARADQSWVNDPEQVAALTSALSAGGVLAVNVIAEANLMAPEHSLAFSRMMAVLVPLIRYLETAAEALDASGTLTPDAINLVRRVLEDLATEREAFRNLYATLSSVGMDRSAREASPSTIASAHERGAVVHPELASLCLNQSEPVEVAPDFCWLRYQGVTYEFTPGQRGVIRELVKDWQIDGAGLSEAYLMDRAGQKDGALRNLFRDHPAWGTLIVKGGSRDVFKLSLRQEKTVTREIRA
jgi:hypothetical protein